MNIKSFYNNTVVLPDYDHSEIYWNKLSKNIDDKYGRIETSDPKLVQEILLESFNKCCEYLTEKINEQRRASFFIFCHYLHEESIKLWSKTLEGYSLGDYESDFALSRRILKIILEQSTMLELKGTPNFYMEIVYNLRQYVDHLEELLYIGTQCFFFNDKLSKSQLFNKSISIGFDEEGLRIDDEYYHSLLFEIISKDIPTHDKTVAISKCMEEFIDILKVNFNVDYKLLAQFTSNQLTKPKQKFCLFELENLLNIFNEDLGYDKDFLKVFFSGLTITSKNVLKVGDSIFKSQHENRYSYRPIIELNIDKKKYHLLGFYKWGESFLTLSTNCFPFGIFPSEWKSYNIINNFVIHVRDTHDEILEEPVRNILVENKFIFDSKCKSFMQKKGNNINISKDIGDIDIIFINEKNSTIYICECKHNRSKFDINNWKKEYSKFPDEHEIQLNRKVEWAHENKKIIEEHMQLKYPEKDNITLSEYKIEGLFIINAPTIYMYNGKYKTLTINLIKKLLKGEDVHSPYKIKEKNKDKFIDLSYPYFDSINALI